MLRKPMILTSLVLFTCPLLVNSATLRAADGDPLAIRNWPGDMVSLESHWGFHVVINPDGNALKQLPRAPDQSVSTSETIDHYLTRKPNAAKAAWVPSAAFTETDPNAIHIKTLPAKGDSANPLLLEVDGTRLAFIPDECLAAPADVLVNDMKSVDLLVLSTADPSRLTDPRVIALVKSIAPRLVLLSNIDAGQRESAETFRKAIGAEEEVMRTDHNTLAVSQSRSPEYQTQVVVLDDSPWLMPDELATLFAGMEKSNRNSQKVFAKLSPLQLNFRPGNGTHTPRWNTEHMMGRQLLFFSQIYHAQKPAIPVMDLNPKQMPPDYMAAHSDWDGGEEARQTQRVSDFTQRFAYLLDGLNLDQKAPGSRWTPRRLLKQMESHYNEHTANTIKKFDLPDWPKE
ncbi:hypothetical protein CA54_21770 [Symmachiella macrocystis]|uniref:Uncharacterized protein n=1 Tax=Symmachiella macrocystis TaxID=2527985 RepID=A0A5C6BNT7_9PLAN|nr:DinB family protein [Symmachiella macrocystis]TWU13342.1 hypothetical protein CA54_21770 [Symmachiella macrocystis]